MGLGHRAILAHMGIKARVRRWTDGTATVGVCARQGLGKLRHVSTQSLWIQQRAPVTSRLSVYMSLPTDLYLSRHGFGLGPGFGTLTLFEEQ